MRDKFTTFIMSLVIISILAIMIVFGMMIYNELSQVSDVNVDNFKYAEQTTNTVQNNIETPKILENNPLDDIESSEVSNRPISNIDYSNVNINKFFYNQLDEYSKTIYKAFESNKENMKTGTYQVDLGTSFSDLLSSQNGSELLGKYYQSAIEAYTYDNPDVFYLNPNKMYLNIETTTKGSNVTYNVFINSGNQSNYLTDEFSSKPQIDTAINQIEQVRNEILQNRTGDIYEDIKMIHDHLVDNVTYDSSLSKPYIYNIYGAMVEKNCVCEGYAKSMKYLLDYIDVECTLVIGKGRNSEGKIENHAWNYVKIENQWYAIDATWDDPVIIGGGNLPNSYKYKYFLKGSNDMQKDHTPEGQFTQGGKVFEYPTLSVYNYEQ